MAASAFDGAKNQEHSSYVEYALTVCGTWRNKAIYRVRYHNQQSIYSKLKSTIGDSKRYDSGPAAQPHHVRDAAAGVEVRGQGAAQQRDVAVAQERGPDHDAVDDQQGVRVQHGVAARPPALRRGRRALHVRRQQRRGPAAVGLCLPQRRMWGDYTRRETHCSYQLKKSWRRIFIYRMMLFVLKLFRSSYKFSVEKKSGSQNKPLMISVCNI